MEGYIKMKIKYIQICHWIKPINIDFSKGLQAEKHMRFTPIKKEEEEKERAKENCCQEYSAIPKVL